MIPQLEFGTVSNPEEAPSLGKIICQCFNFPAERWQLFSSRIGLENFRVVRKVGQVVAGLGMYQMGQWFGGCSVPMVGIASVGVTPEHRGTGVAAFLLTQTLKELYANGVPLSALYASTSALYRQVGYEQAGNACIFALPINSITLRDLSLPIYQVEPTHHKVFHDLYRQRAVINSGNLDRNQSIWERVVQPQEEVVYAYLVGTEEQPEGYVIFSQKQEAKRYNLLAWDLVALTPAAGHCLWTFFATHRSLAEEVRWRGPVIDPLLSLLPQTYRVVHLERWLLRVVNVKKALEKRGYPVGVETELHLAIQDDLLPENNRRFILTVSGGQGEVTRGGRGELQLDVRGLAPLYTGLFTPHQLQSTGQMKATTSALSAAAQVFAGPEPWMADHF
jgi:predicted acetyltransferase